MRALAVSLLLVSGTLAAEEALSLRLIGPSKLSSGRPFTLRFEVTNRGRVPMYFKHPWKWASNGMQVVASGPSAPILSSTRLFDIPTELVCTHFIPLRPGESFSFTQEFNASAAGLTLALAPGSYELVWPYAARHYPSEGACAAASWPIWQGSASSPPLHVEVVQ